MRRMVLLLGVVTTALLVAGGDGFGGDRIGAADGMRAAISFERQLIHELYPDAPRLDGDGSAREQLEAAEKRLDWLLDCVSRSDTKFSIILGVDTGMLGFLAPSAPAGTVPITAILFAAASAALLVASLIFI